MHTFMLLCKTVTSQFGKDSAPILPLNFFCNGSEVELNMCTNITAQYSFKGCQKVAGVICEGMKDIFPSKKV